jgi:hydroxymethylbilane synthase
VESHPQPLRIGTRGSALARWQAEHVAGLIRALGVPVTIEIIATSGDLDPRSPFALMADKGVFVKELEQALLERRIDLAVHSLKDLPTTLPAGLELAGVPEREDPRDALISRDHSSLEALPAGARVATGSLRRGAQILALRPDLALIALRGNVPTRIEKIRRGEADATLLAVAGLRRLGLESEIAQILSVDWLTPPMGQGALALEARQGERPALWAALEHAPTRLAVEAERRFLARVGGGCRTPVGILAEPNQDVWQLTAMLAAAEGQPLMRRRAQTAPGEDPRQAADQLAMQMIAEAPPEILAMLGRWSDLSTPSTPPNPTEAGEEA